MRTELPKLYKRTQTGAIQMWQIIQQDNTFYAMSGQVDGKITQSKPTVCNAKNTGRANSTSAEEQALKEAKAKWTKKTESGFYEDINRIDEGKTFFDCMLAKKYDTYKDKLAGRKLLVSNKLDGLRMLSTKNGLSTRNGKAFNSCPHIERILKPLFEKHPNWVIDGEIYSSEVPFEKIVSLTRKREPTIEEIKESAKYCQLWIFDGVTDDTSKGFENRFEEIRTEIKNLIGENKSIVFVENEVVSSHEEVVAKHDQYVAAGMEGIMIRIPGSPYENKRSKNLLKLKNFLDQEFIIADVLEGKGNRSGMAGRLLFNYKDSQFHSGIKGGEEFYKELLINKEKYIGKKATVRFQEWTQEGQPRFPVCVNVDPIDR